MRPVNRRRRGLVVDTQSQSTNAGDLVFAELIVPKKTAYVGEIVPVQIRMGFDARVHPRLTEPPDITGQGFTSQKLQQSSQNLETINGRPFEVVTFKTAIAAARAGKFEIGPVKAKAQVVVPRRRNAPRSRSPFDLFDLDDPFSDPFFSNPFAQFGERRDIQISSDPVALEVKPLPPNAPPSFSGAIGSFTMATDAKPKSVQVGDPITVTTTISGRGNFDRVNAPLLEDDRGWHKYPPSSKFKQDDEVGISGTKTFETVVSPNENKQSLPVLAFSYFDPAKEQYVTLHSESMAITVQGGAAAPAVAAQPPSSSPATATRGRAPVPNSTKPQDILYQLTEPSRTVESFEPLYTRRGFWAAQSLPLAALLVFAGWKIRRARLDDREARRIGALQHEAAELMHKLRRDDASPREYYAEASRVVRLKAALASRNRGVDPNAVDAETAAETFKLDTDSRDRLRRLFEQNDEWQYSGTHNGPGSISPENRRDVLELIENLKHETFHVIPSEAKRVEEFVNGRSVMSRDPCPLGDDSKLWFFSARWDRYVRFRQPDAEFTKANQEYAQGNFKEAIASYEALVRADQWNANLFYDLGNAYFRTRDFGRAILNYERALALDQHHPEATANLQIARDESRALELQPTRLERYLQFASINQYSIAAAVAFWLGIFGIVALIFARRRSAALMSLSILCLLVCAVAVWAIHTLDNGSKGRALAIVTGNDVQARLATADTANSVLALPAGSEIKILSTRGDWMYAALPNDLRGWIQTKNAEQVRL